MTNFVLRLRDSVICGKIYFTKKEVVYSVESLLQLLPLQTVKQYILLM